MNRPILAWEKAEWYRRDWGDDRTGAPPLPPRIEYALRRIGGLTKLGRVIEFVQAYNEAPFVDGAEEPCTTKK